MEKYIHRSYYFYGHEVSDYGKKHGYIDYKTLSRCFDAVLNNEIIAKTWGTCGEWELVNGYTDDEDDAQEVYQWFIIDDRGARILQELTDEILYYNDFLDVYVWGVTHYGTSWDYVLTDIKIEMEDETR